MTKRCMLLFTAALLVFALTALAADISGTWTAEMPAGKKGNAQQRTFTFKVEGEKLTGTVGNRQRGTPITDGKIAGDAVSFKVTRERGGNSITEIYTGTVSGSEIKFKMERQGRGRPVEFTAKKAN